MKVYNNTGDFLKAIIWQNSETFHDQEPERENISPKSEYELSDTPGTEASLMGPKGECVIKVFSGERQIIEVGNLRLNVVGRNMGMISTV